MYQVKLLPKVEKWISKLTDTQAKKIFALLGMLRGFGHKLRMPIVRKLGADLFELREMESGLRVYYTYKGDFLYIALLGGNKSSQKQDIKKARKAVKKVLSKN